MVFPLGESKTLLLGPEEESGYKTTQFKPTGHRFQGNRVGGHVLLARLLEEPLHQGHSMCPGICPLTSEPLTLPSRLGSICRGFSQFCLFGFDTCFTFFSITVSYFSWGNQSFPSMRRVMGTMGQADERAFLWIMVRNQSRHVMKPYMGGRPDLVHGTPF